MGKYAIEVVNMVSVIEKHKNEPDRGQDPKSLKYNMIKEDPLEEGESWRPPSPS